MVPLSTRVRLLIFSDFPEIFQGNNDQSSHSHCWWRSQGIFLFPCLTHALQHALRFTIFNVITQYPNGCQLLSNNVSLNNIPLLWSTLLDPRLLLPRFRIIMKVAYYLRRDNCICHTAAGGYRSIPTVWTLPKRSIECSSLGRSLRRPSGLS